MKKRVNQSERYLRTKDSHLWTINIEEYKQIYSFAPKGYSIGKPNQSVKYCVPLSSLWHFSVG